MPAPDIIRLLLNMLVLLSFPEKSILVRVSTHYIPKVSTELTYIGTYLSI